jgi:copper(I)-binding protein
MKDLSQRRAARCLTAALLAAIVLTPMLPNRALADSRPAPKPTIQVLAAWIRWLPAGLPAAGYLTLTNTGTKPLVLRSASSPWYANVSIHRTVTRAGIEEMRPVTDLTLEPHQTLNFESSGYHLMLMQPKDSSAGAAAGTTVPVILHFSDGSLLTIPFEVRKTPGTSAAP